MTDEFVFDEKEHAYFLNGKPMLGCTSVLGVIAKPALIQWAANEAVKYAKAKGRECTTAGGPQMWEITDIALEEARTAHRRKKEEAADKGTDLHAIVEAWVKQCIDSALGAPSVPAPEPIQAFASWAQKEGIRFIASE